MRRRVEIIGKVGKRNIERGIRGMREMRAAVALDRDGSGREPAEVARRPGPRLFILRIGKRSDRSSSETYLESISFG